MKIAPLVLAIAFFSSASHADAAIKIAPQNRVNLFLNSASPFTSSDWTIATSGTLGTVNILRSTGNTTYYLLLNMPANLGIPGTGKKFLLDSVNYAGISHSRISDTANVPGQCVDFAKEMIGSEGETKFWHKNSIYKLSGIPASQRASTLVPGTMIAHFGNSTDQYPTDGSGHVAIVLSVDNSGIMVVDQNFANGYSLTVNGTTYSASSSNLIAKHFMPWSGGIGKNDAGAYYIVDVY